MLHVVLLECSLLGSSSNRNSGILDKHPWITVHPQQLIIPMAEHGGGLRRTHSLSAEWQQRSKNLVQFSSWTEDDPQKTLQSHWFQGEGTLVGKSVSLNGKQVSRGGKQATALQNLPPSHHIFMFLQPEFYHCWGWTLYNIGVPYRLC